MAASFYRAYLFGPDGTITFVKLLDAQTESEARERAREIAGFYGIEAREGARFIAHVEPKQAATTRHEMLDSRSAYAMRGFASLVPDVTAEHQKQQPPVR